MDLISRKAAIEAVKISDYGCNNPSERHGIIFARVEARRAIQSIPSVPAVPLDKLCEWLGEHHAYYSYFVMDRFAWRNVLTKWMEGFGDGKAD